MIKNMEIKMEIEILDILKVIFVGSITLFLVWNVTRLDRESKKSEE
jgi:hypothetical protein